MKHHQPPSAVCINLYPSFSEDCLGVLLHGAAPTCRFDCKISSQAPWHLQVLTSPLQQHWLEKLGELWPRSQYVKVCSVSTSWYPQIVGSHGFSRVETCKNPSILPLMLRGTTMDMPTLVDDPEGLLPDLEKSESMVRVPKNQLV